MDSSALQSRMPSSVWCANSARPRVGKNELKGMLEFHGGSFTGQDLGSRAQLSPVTTASKLRAAMGDEPQVRTHLFQPPSCIRVHLP